MLVSNFTTINLNKSDKISPQLPVQTPIKFTGIKTCDTVEISNLSKEQQAEKILDKLPNFTIKEYKKLSETETSFLREQYDDLIKRNKHFEYLKKFEQKHELAATQMKEYFDKIYGEGKYKVLTIGRSLSSIGKTLGYKIGEENVVNLPISFAMKYNKKKFLDYILTEPEADDFKEFLKEHNLSKKDINKTGKTYIIVDYCYSGDSLRGAKSLLTSKKLLGKNHVVAIDFKECINEEDYFKEFDASLNRCDFKQWSFVHKAPNLRAQNHIVDTKNKELERRLFWFKLLDNQMKTPPIEKPLPPKPQQQFGKIEYLKKLAEKFISKIHIK